MLDKLDPPFPAVGVREGEPVPDDMGQNDMLLPVLRIVPLRPDGTEYKIDEAKNMNQAERETHLVRVRLDLILAGPTRSMLPMFILGMTAFGEDMKRAYEGDKPERVN